MPVKEYTTPPRDLSGFPGQKLLVDAEEPETDVKPFTLWRPSQFVEYVSPEGSVILGDHLLELGKWLSVVGVGGLGKTRLILFLAVCQILQREWCGISTKGKPLKWVFLSGENGVTRWKTDLQAMLAGLTKEEAALVDEHLRILAMIDDEDGDLNAANPHALARLQLTLRQESPGVVVFDPWADMIAGDENKTVDVVATLRVLRPIIRTEAPTAAVIVIHHGRTGAGNVGQAGDNYSAGNFGRGAKALYSAVRAEIQLAPGDRDDSNKIVLACGKNSDGPKFQPRGITFDAESMSYAVDQSFDVEAWRTDVNGQKGTGKTCTVADVVQAVREKYTPGEDVTTGYVTEKVKEWTGTTPKTVQRRLVEAQKSSYLRAGSKRGTWRLGAKVLK